MRCRPRILVLLVPFAFLAYAGLIGCAPSSSPPSETLRLPLYGAAGIPDPALVSTPDDMFLASLLYSGLVKFSPDLHVIPELAVSIPTISNDGRTYTFTVRGDARFADGSRCTGADIAYSLARALNPGLGSWIARKYLGNIEGAARVEQGRAQRLSGVRVSHDLTVRIRLVRPDAAFLEKLASPVAYVVDRRAVGYHPIPSWSTSPAGTGPWTILRRDRNGTLTLTHRHNFYGSALQLRSLVLVPVRTQANALDQYRKGSLDAVAVPLEQYASMASRSDFHQSASLDAFYALPQHGDAVPLASSLDRGRLLQDAAPGLSPLDSVVPPAVPDYIASIPSFNPGSGGDPATLPQVSLQVEATHTVALASLRRALRRQWPGARQGGLRVRLIQASSLLPDPAAWLRIVLGQTQSHWYRTMLARSMQLTNDPVTRMSSYSEGENWALQNALIIPLATVDVAYLVKPEVQDLQVTPLGIMPQNDNWSLVTVT